MRLIFSDTVSIPYRYKVYPYRTDTSVLLLYTVIIIKWVYIN